MDSLEAVRRVREKMSRTAAHDVRRLIAAINEARVKEAARIISPGRRAEKVATATNG